MNTEQAGAASKKIVTRVAVSRVLNALLWTVFCAMSGTGLLLAFRLRGGGGGRMSALGMSRHEWGDWHTWLSYAFLALIAIHLALHWRWFWQVAAKRRSWPLIAGIGAGLVLMLALLFQPVTPAAGGRGAEREKERGKESTENLEVKKSGECDGMCERCKHPCGDN